MSRVLRSVLVAVLLVSSGVGIWFSAGKRPAATSDGPPHEDRRNASVDGEAESATAESRQSQPGESQRARGSVLSEGRVPAEIADDPPTRSYETTRRHLEVKIEQLEQLDLEAELDKSVLGVPSSVYLPKSLGEVVRSRALNTGQMPLEEAKRLGLIGFLKDWNRRVHEASVPLQSGTWAECLARLDRGEFLSQPQGLDLSDLIQQASQEGAVLSINPGEEQGQRLHRVFYISRDEAPELANRREVLREQVMARQRALQEWFAQFR